MGRWQLALQRRTQGGLKRDVEWEIFKGKQDALSHTLLAHYDTRQDLPKKLSSKEVSSAFSQEWPGVRCRQ